MSYAEKFLANNERIVETTCYPHSFDDAGEFLVHVVRRDGLNTGDEVLIEVPRATEPCVLIGGNPLQLHVESGAGRLVMRKLENGEETTDALIEGDDKIIPTANTLYWYERVMGNALVVRDHCDDFDPRNEPNLFSVVSALSTVFLGSARSAREQ